MPMGLISSLCSELFHEADNVAREALLDSIMAASGTVPTNENGQPTPSAIDCQEKIWKNLGVIKYTTSTVKADNGRSAASFAMVHAKDDKGEEAGNLFSAATTGTVMSVLGNIKVTFNPLPKETDTKGRMKGKQKGNQICAFVKSHVSKNIDIEQDPEALHCRWLDHCSIR
jgi:hypothetical protein